MSNLKKYQNKKIAVYGMGKSGLSSALRLKKIAQVLCWDDNKKIRSNLNKLGLVNNKFWLNKKKKIDYIVISPGIDINKCKISNYLKKNKNKIITDLDIFFESNKNVPIISVTGTNGKSTTCKIIQKILIKAGYNARV